MVLRGQATHLEQDVEDIEKKLYYARLAAAGFGNQTVEQMAKAGVAVKTLTGELKTLNHWHDVGAGKTSVAFGRTAAIAFAGAFYDIGSFRCRAGTRRRRTPSTWAAVSTRTFSTRRFKVQGTLVGGALGGGGFAKGTLLYLSPRQETPAQPPRPARRPPRSTARRPAPGTCSSP